MYYPLDKINWKVNTGISNKKKDTPMNQKLRPYNKHMVMLINDVINDWVYIINL